MGMVHRAEAWLSQHRIVAGYVIWSIALAVFAVPELLASKYSNLSFPTLSGTVGHLERRWELTSFFVVLVMVFALMHAVRIGTVVVRRPAQPTDTQRLPATTVPLDSGHNVAVVTGRVTDDPNPAYLGWLAYLVLAAGLVVVGFLAPLAAYGWDVSDAEKQLSGEAGYGAIALAFFVVPGIAAWKLGRLAPFPTLFKTFVDLQQRRHFVSVLVAGGLGFLLLHLVFYPYPSIIPWFKDLEHVHDYCAAHASDAICRGR